MSNDFIFCEIKSVLFYHTWKFADPTNLLLSLQNEVILIVDSNIDIKCAVAIWIVAAMTGIEIIGLIASILQLAGFLCGLIKQIHNLFMNSLRLTSRCREYSKFLSLVANTVKPYMNLVREEKSPMGKIMKGVKDELKKARKLVSDMLGKKGVQRCLSAYRFPKKLKESEEMIWRFLNLLPLAAGPTVQGTPAGPSASKARKTARATRATNRGRGLPPKAPAFGSSASRAQPALLPTSPVPASTSRARQCVQVTPAQASTSKARQTARATPPKAPASSSSASRAQQVILPIPTAPASTSRARQGPLGTPPAASRSTQIPLPTPPVRKSTSKGKGKSTSKGKEKA